MSTESLNEKQKMLEAQAIQVNEMVQTILATHCSELDAYVAAIREQWIGQNQQPADAQIDDVIVKIPLFLYGAGSILERLGIEEDLAKLNKANRHNAALLESVGTVVEKSAKAENAVTEDVVIHLAYKGAYKQMQQKFTIALELLNSAKKIQHKRIAEMNLGGGR